MDIQQNSMFDVQVDTVRELTPQQVDNVGGGGNDTYLLWITWTLVPGTEETAYTVITAA